MMSIRGFRTKKALKEAVAGDAPVYAHRVLVDTSIFGSEIKDHGTAAIVGPSPYERKWFAQITITDGRITKVS